MENKYIDWIIKEDAHLWVAGTEVEVLRDGTELVTKDTITNTYRVYHEVLKVDYLTGNWS